MKTLLQFLKRFSLLLQFLFLEAVAIIMLIQFNGYQRSVVLSSANWVSGFLFEGVDVVSDYFDLHEKNQDLSAENAALKNEIEHLRAQQEPAVFGHLHLYGSRHRQAYPQLYRLRQAGKNPHRTRRHARVNKREDSGYSLKTPPCRGRL